MISASFSIVGAQLPEALGGRPSDRLGWDPAQPYLPIAKHVGIIWKLDGDIVVELTRDTVTIARNGVRRTFRRRTLQ